ncbi:MAG: type I restriction endonuclease subunit R, partial [Nanoarchaeota archaeon]
MNEQDVEDAAIDILKDLGYRHLHGPDIAPDSDNPLREKWNEVILASILRDAIKLNNPKLPNDAIEETIKKVKRLAGHQLKQNEKFHQFLTQGVPLQYRAKNGKVTDDYIQLLGEKNSFHVVSQFTIIEKENNRRPDLIVFINGLPISVIELKNSASEKASIESAYQQLQTYLQEIPTLFNFNELLVISDGTYAQVGTITSSREWFLPWKTIDGKEVAPATVSQMGVLFEGMFEKNRILDIITNFITFHKSKKQTNKILAGYHQYHAANKAIKKTINAVNKNGKAGVIWHTQGSGKSFTLAFYAGKIQVQEELNNPTLVILTDRNDLDDQLFNTFSSLNCLRETPMQANSKEKLKELLKRKSGGIIFTTIQKFGSDSGEFEALSKRSNIIIAADEAHRTQYGFKAKVDKKTGKTSYGFAKYLRDALPNATFIGFTGTPIDFEDKSTRQIFGNYIDIYDIEQSVQDERTVKIYYESRLAQLHLNKEQKDDIDEGVDEVTEGEEQNRKQQLKRKWAQLEAIVGSSTRIKQIAQDIVNHFEARQENMPDGKAMVVCMSRRICIELHNEIKKLRPKWYNNDDEKGLMKVIMTGSAQDGPKWQEHIRDKRRRKEMAEIFKDPSSDFKLAIVRDMWLTGFDAPSLNTLYIDKPMKGHGLMQAIARVNRVYKNKQGGLIVDYLGIAHELKKAVSNYVDSDGRGKPVHNQSAAIATMKEKYEIVSQMFHGFNYKKFFSAKPKEKMDILSAAMNHVIRPEDRKKRFIRETTALSKAYSLSVPSEQAEKLRDEVGFFLAVKASIIKNTETTTTEKTDENLNSAMKQIVSSAVASDGVIDVFQTAGMKKPEISVLSDKFLDDVKNMQHKNLAFEALKKLLKDQIKARFKQNKVKDRKFSEMLEKAIQKYQNRSIDSAQIIQELVNLAKDIRKEKSRGKELGLNEQEEAFYDALADNGSARELLGDEVLKEMARKLSEVIRNKASIDWQIKTNVRADLKRMVKRLLRQYGYPPDKQKMATDLVIEQAEGFAEKESESAIYDHLYDS